MPESKDEPTTLELSLRKDGWENMLTGLGTKTRDKRMSATVTTAPVLDQGTLDELYYGDDLIATIIDLPAKEMVREWIAPTVDPGTDEDGKPTMEQEDAAKIGKEMMEALDALNAQSKVGEAITWARLHGGCLIIMGIDDGQDPSEPLNEEGIKSLSWLTVIDRWDVAIHRRYQDPMADKFGEPELYQITNTTASTSLVDSSGRQISGFFGVIHESRVLRFDGVLTSRRRQVQLTGWSDTVVTRIWEVVRDFQAAWGGTSHLLTDFAQAVFKIKDLAHLLATDQEDLVIRRLTLLDLARSVCRAVPIDAEHEDFERKQTPLSGLADLLDRFASRLSAAARIPVTLLMGESPAGLQATGAADIRNFYDSVSSEQEFSLRPKINRLMKLLYLSKTGPTTGQEPEGWGFVFVPLWQATEKEEAETKKTVAEADEIYIATGVLSPEEVANSRFGGQAYSAETTLDPELRGESVDPEDADPNAPDPEVDPTITTDPEPTPAAPTTTDPAQDPEAVSPTTALNGAQVTSMLELVDKVAKGELPRATGVEMLTAAFPFDRDQASAIMGTVGAGFEPKATTPASAPTPPVPPPPMPPPTGNPEPDDDEEGGDE